MQAYQRQTRSIENMFPKDQLNQEAISELKRFLEIEELTKEIYSTRLATPKKIGFMTFENIGLYNHWN